MSAQSTQVVQIAPVLPEEPGDWWGAGARDVRGACEFLGVGRSKLFALMKEKKLVWALIDGKRVVAVRSMKALLQRSQVAAA